MLNKNNDGIYIEKSLKAKSECMNYITIGNCLNILKTLHFSVVSFYIFSVSRSQIVFQEFKLDSENSQLMVYYVIGLDTPIS